MDVFVVEDSDAQRALICARLAQIDGFVLAGEFIGASRAIQALRDRAPHIVLLDIELAEGSGIDVLRVATRDYPATLIIVVTSFADPATRRHFIQEGAYAIFDKSFELNRLWSLLEWLAAMAARQTTGGGTGASSSARAHPVQLGHRLSTEPSRFCTTPGATAGVPTARPRRGRKPCR